ncbi:hypothetical protein BHE74_00037821 [Ensete ventricosum]|nr:hypothetical protein BHE74_00037821 [Ensete ventricosum]
MLEQNFPFQVAEPLRAMVMGAPLEDARHLAQRYDRVRQEAEAQVILLQTTIIILSGKLSFCDTGKSIHKAPLFEDMLDSQQAIEVSKRQIKVRETVGSGDNISKLEAAEAKLQDLKSNMAVLGKEAVAAMTAVEAQQQRLTLQRLIAMVLSLFMPAIIYISCCYSLLHV